MKQKNTSSNIFMYIAIFATILLISAINVNAVGENPTAPDLGEAGRFVILASQTVTTTVGSNITGGDIGVEDQARTFITGFTSTGPAGDFTELTGGTSYASDDSNPAPFPYPLHYSTLPVGATWTTSGAMITQAKTDLGIAFTYLAADPNPDAPTISCPTELGNLTLTRGVYKTASNVIIQQGNLTLDAEGNPNSVWIFNIVGTGTLITGAPGGNIILANGAQAKNVYWRTAGKTVIGTNTVFYGNVFAWTEVNALTGANITGKLFASTDQVTLQSNIVTSPTGTSSPVVTLVNPTTNTWNTSNMPAFTFKYVGASTASCTLYANNVSVGTNSSVVNNTNTAITANAQLSEGNNSWYMSCDDGSVVTNSSNRMVFIDTIMPTSLINSINNVSNGYGTNDTTLSINFTANDTNLINWTLSVYNSTGGLLQNWTATTINLSAIETYTVTTNGTYYVNLTVRDNATNINTTSFTVYVDQTAPVTNSVSSGSVTSSGATITINASDMYSGINNCTYTGAGSGNLILSNGVYTASLSGLSSSTAYTVNITCYDKAGYSVSNTTSFTTDAAVVQPPASTGGGGGGSSGGTPLQCETWSTCNSEGVSSQICYTDNSNTTLTRTKSCTPGQTTVPKQNVTTPVTDTGNNGQNTWAVNQTTPVVQDNNGNTPNDGNQITGNVALESSPTGIWSTIGRWWSQFIYWITHIFG
jgi:hypothetical protein